MPDNRDALKDAPRNIRRETVTIAPGVQETAGFWKFMTYTLMLRSGLTDISLPFSELPTELALSYGIDFEGEAVHLKRMAPPNEFRAIPAGRPN